VHDEISAATAALEPWPEQAPTALLNQLCLILRQQVAALQSA
jgi:hypothetical protein